MSIQKNLPTVEIFFHLLIHAFPINVLPNRPQTPTAQIDE
jgi:hypothetical protein